MLISGECYQYCNVVICGGNSLNVYSSSCKIPVGQIDCLDVVEYNVASCNHDDTVQVDDGFLHVRNKCRATFKICSGPGMDFNNCMYTNDYIHLGPPKCQIDAY